MASAVAGSIAGSIGSSLLGFGANLLTSKGDSSTWQLPNGAKISELDCWQEGSGASCPKANCLASRGGGNVIIKDEPVSCPFCLGQCRTQICCKAQKEAENNENAISTSVIVLGSIVIALVLIFVLVGALLYHFKSWKNLKAKVAVAKRLVCCKGKGYKGRGGQRGGRVGNIGPVRNV